MSKGASRNYGLCSEMSIQPKRQLVEKGSDTLLS